MNVVMPMTELVELVDDGPWAELMMPNHMVANHRPYDSDEIADGFALDGWELEELEAEGPFGCVTARAVELFDRIKMRELDCFAAERRELELLALVIDVERLLDDMGARAARYLVPAEHLDLVAECDELHTLLVAELKGA